MPRGYNELPDLKKLGMFWTDVDPDNPALVIWFQEYLTADIPTYQAVGDNISTGANKNMLSIFNNLPTKRIRVQEVFIYPRTLANIVCTFQLGYINSAPTGGTDIDLIRHAADYVANPSPPNNVIAQSANTAPNPVAGWLFGGITANMNTAGKYTLFEAKRNASALILRPTLDGLTVRQTAGTGTTASVTVHIIFSLD